MQRLNKKGDWPFLVKNVLYVLLCFTVIVIIVVYAVNSMKDLDIEKLERCRLSLQVKEHVDDVKGFLMYVTTTPDLCSTIDKKGLPRYGNDRYALEDEIMDLIGQAWKYSLEGKPHIFGHQIFANPNCFKVFIFQVKPLSDLQEGEVLPYLDFKNNLGLYDYKEFDVYGERMMYTVLDYVQDSPNEGSEPGRIEVFPSVHDPLFCIDPVTHARLPEIECNRKKEGVGFRPKGVYAIAVVSGQGAFESLTHPESKINYIVIDTDTNIRRYCGE